MANIKNTKAKNLSKTSFKKIVTSCKSMTEASKLLDIPFSTFKRYAEKYNCYTANPSGKGIYKNRKKLKDITENIVTIKTCNLKHKLIKLGIKQNRCEICGLGDKWKNKPISLELHHIDGHHKNNELTNLQLLCPNCHSQTSNYRRRKRVVKEETL
jgi:Zn finger protein HypA/HybF involved in hydrogenase expression